MPRADVVLAVGTRITGFMRGPTALREPQRLVHIDVDEREFGKNYPPTVALHADAARALQALRKEVLRRGAARSGASERNRLWKPPPTTQGSRSESATARRAPIGRRQSACRNSRTWPHASRAAAFI